MNLGERVDMFPAACMMMKNLGSRILLKSIFYKSGGLTGNGVAVPLNAGEGGGCGLDAQASGVTTNRRRRRFPDQTRAARVKEDLGAAALEAFREEARRSEICRAALARGRR